MDRLDPGTYQKALRINVDATRHGTFAEIGAGQETARWFFHVGGAAGTVAKTISAYDMAFSDALYGPCDQYVSRQRLGSMLDHEYGLLLERLGGRRSGDIRFFVFADTVATHSFTRHDEGHGWMGVRFEHEPQAPPSEILVHARVHETENVRQQEAFGVLGVNLIFGACYLSEDPTTLIGSLMDGLTRERVEVDTIKFSGPSYAGVDNRLMSLQLVQQDITDTVIFTADGEVVQAAEILHKRPILVERGSFRPVTNPTIDMLERALSRILEERAGTDEPPVAIMEMTLRNLLEGDQIDHADFLARADVLGSLGQSVMISRHGHDFRLAEYLRLYTSLPISFVMGVPSFLRLFEEAYYAGTEGGILESIGRLFQSGIKVYVYPYKDNAAGELITAENLGVVPHLKHLYAYLLENRFVESIKNVDESQLHLLPRDVLAMIRSGDSSWETLVPRQIVPLVKAHGIYGYRPTPKYIPRRIER